MDGALSTALKLTIPPGVARGLETAVALILTRFCSGPTGWPAAPP